MVLLASILLPLYLYPQPGAWNWVTNAVATYPSIDFNIIVNPHSGPGPANSFPDALYIDAIASMNAFENTNLLGYVDTDYMHRDVGLVIADIDTYNFWSTNPKDIHVSGIFFDDCVSNWNGTSSVYMSTIAAYAHADDFTVTFNPGVLADAAFFNIADNILMVEAEYDATKSLARVVGIPANQRAKSSVMFHHFTGTASEQIALITSILRAGITSLYITTVDYVSEGALWMQFVDAVDKEIEARGYE